LPAPDGPTIATCSPGAIARSMSSSTVVPAASTVSPDIAIATPRPAGGATDAEGSAGPARSTGSTGSTGSGVLSGSSSRSTTLRIVGYWRATSATSWPSAGRLSAQYTSSRPPAELSATLHTMTTAITSPTAVSTPSTTVAAAW